MSPPGPSGLRERLLAKRASLLEKFVFQLRTRRHTPEGIYLET